MKYRRLSIVLIVVLLSLGLTWCTAFQFPPSLLPPASYEVSQAVLGKENELKQLVPKYEEDVKAYLKTSQNKNLVYVKVGGDYIRRFDSIVGDNLTPEDLANLAIWAEPKALNPKSLEPERLKPEGDIYQIVFYRTIARLGQKKGIRERYALWRVRQNVVLSGDFDGAPGEALMDAASQ